MGVIETNSSKMAVCLQLACKLKKLICSSGCCFLSESQNLTSKLQTNCIFIVIIETQTQPTWMIALEMISVKNAQLMILVHIQTFPTFRLLTLLFSL